MTSALTHAHWQPACPDAAAPVTASSQHLRQFGTGHPGYWNQGVRYRIHVEDAVCDGLACSGSLDDCLRPVISNIAACVNAGHRGFECSRIDLDVAAIIQGNRLTIEEVEQGLLADREDQSIEGDLEFRALDVMRDLATGCVTVAAILGPGGDQPDQLAVLHMERCRIRQLLDRDALLEACMNLFAVGRHLIDRTAIDDGDIGGADPPSRPRAVHRGVAGADDTDPGTDDLD